MNVGHVVVVVASRFQPLYFLFLFLLDDLILTIGGAGPHQEDVRPGADGDESDKGEDFELGGGRGRRRRIETVVLLLLQVGLTKGSLQGSGCLIRAGWK